MINDRDAISMHRQAPSVRGDKSTVPVRRHTLTMSNKHTLSGFVTQDVKGANHNLTWSGNTHTYYDVHIRTVTHY
jgi:hypothetical protein